VIALVESRKPENRRDLRKLRANREIETEGVTFLPVPRISDQNSYFQGSDFEIRMRIF
jgi:hypothetical protein